MTSSTNSNVDFSLTRGSLKMMLDGETLNTVTLQILGYKRVPGEGNERFRLLLNDGTMLYSFVILATHLNHLIVSKKLEKFSIFKLNKYVCTQAQPDKNIIICLEVDPLVDGCHINTQINYSVQEGTNKIAISNIDKVPSNLSSSGVNNNISPQSATQIFENQNIHAGSSTSNSNIQVVCKPSISQVVSQTVQSTTTPKQLFVCNNENNLPLNSNWNMPSTSAVHHHRDDSVVPISGLTPYQNRWTIKARVIYTTKVQDYCNPRRSGKLFSFQLKDKSCEIRATAFDEQAVQLYSFIQLGKVYYISNASVRLPKQGSPSKSDFELCISFNTKIELFCGADIDIPGIDFKFTSLSQINGAMNGFADVIGICIDASEIRNIVVRATNREVQKLDVTLIDMTSTRIIVSLWGNDAEEFNPLGYPVIAIKDAKITHFNGCSLSVSPSSMFFVNPDLQDARLLKSWFKENNNTLNLKIVLDSDRNQKWKNFIDINIDSFKNLDKAEYYSVKATIVMAQKENCLYRACPSSECFKKVIPSPNGLYHCPKCNEDYSSFSWTLLLSLNLADFSSDLWAIAFRQTAESIINMKTDELSAIKEQDEDKFLEIVSQLHFKSFIFKLRTILENYNETEKLKTTILGSKPVDPVSYTNKLLSDIRQMERMFNNIS